MYDESKRKKTDAPNVESADSVSDERDREVLSAAGPPRAVSRFEFDDSRRLVLVYRVLPAAQAGIEAFCRNNVRAFLRSNTIANIADFWTIQIGNEMLLFCVVDRYDDTNPNSDWAGITNSNATLVMPRQTALLYPSGHFER